MPPHYYSSIDIEHVSSAWSVFGYLAMDGYLESAQHDFVFGML